MSESETEVRLKYYHQNIKAFSVGVHEAWHILENYLIAKNAEAEDFNLKITARKIVREAYRRTIYTTQGMTIGE